MHRALRASLVLLSTCALLAALPVGVGAATAAKPLTLRIATTTKTVTVPKSSSLGAYFDYSQQVAAKCRSNERSIAPGITSAPRPMASQSFGYNTVSAFAVGQPGKVTFKLQALCAKGGTSSSVVTKRVAGKHVAGIEGTVAGYTTGRTTATASCGKGKIALGTPFANEFAPVLGRLTSKPIGSSSWRVEAHNVPDTLAVSTAMAYADVACVSTKHVKNRALVTKSTTGLHSAMSASLTAACTGGRRPLGWGVDLQPYTRSSYANDGRSWIPTVTKAQLSGSRLSVTFALPDGASTGAANGLSESELKQTVYLVCGTLTGK